ncbi:MAG TPA: hypothetical protein VHJ58_10900 [Vicinamibacterales bacterium]|jgi:ATP-dependent DNA ligase|nr:hypothetical protein [Vicinamibacterales bacterium]
MRRHGEIVALDDRGRQSFQVLQHLSAQTIVLLRLDLQLFTSELHDGERCAQQTGYRLVHSSL